MANEYVGEIRIFAGNFAPAGWMFCDGQLLAISEFDTLFNLIGTTYGGDGQNTFALPDLRGRVPVHFGTLSGSTYQLSENGGVETVTLSQTQIPSHQHTPTASSSAGDQPSPNNTIWAQSSLNQYSVAAVSLPMAAGVVGSTGGSQPHENLPPYLAVNFIISLFGIFPSQT